MTHQPRFRFEQRDETGGVIFDGDDVIAEIRELQLYSTVVKPSFPRRRESRQRASEVPPSLLSQSSHRTPGTSLPEGRVIIGEDVPLPLYWHQYANHQHPERNAGSHGRLECMSSSESKISLKIESASHSREVTSRYLLDVTYSDQLGSYIFEFRCRLDVTEGKQWLVTHNPSHGELEFCNLWPEETFIAGRSDTSSRARPGIQATKRYQACYVRRAGHTEHIPHHHLETSDKHDIRMGPGDRFMWLLEDENPVVEICSSEPVAAGLCAYMWDAHFAYRVCEDGTDVELPSGSSYEAHFKLYAIGREEGEKIVSAATPRPAPEIDSIPIYVDGLNTFVIVIPAQAGIQSPVGISDAWPWEHDPEIPGVIEYALDRTEGHGDNASVRIQAFRPATGRWMATTLGPAFGEPPFEEGKRYRLSAFVKTRNLEGTARIGLRLHRTGIGDVFDIAGYETYYSDDTVSGTSDWTPIEVTTPVIDPPPDRMHLLLEIDGEGTCWFDDVLFERDV